MEFTEENLQTISQMIRSETYPLVINIQKLAEYDSILADRMESALNASERVTAFQVLLSCMKTDIGRLERELERLKSMIEPSSDDV